MSKDKRATDTRQRILEEAAELYHAGGFERISLQAIADSLAISKTALFHHFKNKQELFFEMLLQRVEFYRRLMTAAIAQEPATTRPTLRRVLQALLSAPGFDHMRYMREEQSLLTPEQRDQIASAWFGGMLAQMRQVFAAGVQRGELREHDTTLAAYMFFQLSMLLPRSDTPPERQPHTSTDQSIDALLDMFLHGVAAAAQHEKGANNVNRK